MSAHPVPVKTKRPSEVKGWFLTYPQCTLSPEEALALLRDTVPGNPIRYWVISQEKHQDGGNHIHAWIQYDRKTRFSPDKWVIGGFRGKFEPCQNPVACQKYIRKDGNFIEHLPASKEDQLLGKRAERNHFLFTAPVKQIMLEGHLGALALPQLMRSRSIFHSIQSTGDQSKVRCYWIWGPPGVGKSFFVRSLHEREELYIKAQNKWWDGWQPTHRAVLMDDFDHTGSCLSHYLKIWADSYPFPAEIKGSTITPTYDILYVTSNYSIAQLWKDDEELQAAIERRFHIFHFVDREDPPDI